MGEWKNATKVWLKATLVRVVRSCAQVALAAIGGTAVALDEVPWDAVGDIVGLTAVLVVLTALAGLPEAPSPIRRNGNH